ncbi:PQQ-binding-like beta-propeller repeat protein [Rhizorhabdus histidinilytica]
MAAHGIQSAHWSCLYSLYATRRPLFGGRRIYGAPEKRRGTGDGLRGGAQFETLVVDGDDGKGALVAWDPVAQKIRWKVAYPSMWNGGVLATAGGLVFQGDADGIFHGYDASTGAEAWHYDAKLGIIAAPITYTVRGVQFVSILVGYGGAAGLNSKFVNRGWKYGQQPRRLLTFKLGGKARLPGTAPRDLKVAALDDPALKLNEAEVAEGAALYGSNCAMCHGMALQSSGAPAPIFAIGDRTEARRPGGVLTIGRGFAERHAAL